MRDAYRIAGTVLAAAALGSKARDGFLYRQTVYLVDPDGRMEAFEAGLEGGPPPDEPGSEDGRGAGKRSAQAGAGEEEEATPAS